MMKTTFAMTVAVMAGSAVAAPFEWNWERGDTSVSDNGGRIEAVSSVFNARTGNLTFELTFSNQISNGFTVAINNGPNPKGHAGELALLYFDATNMASVIVSAYNYNGMNTQTSYLDGSPAAGRQDADRLESTIAPTDSPWDITASAEDVDGKRVFRLEMDTTSINNHIPIYPGEGGVDEWFGIGFAEKIGIWLHPVTNLQTEYDESGFLTEWSGRQGWLDTANLDTVPAPGAIAMLGGALALSSRRRRA